MRLELRCPVFTVLLRTTKYGVSALFLHEIKTLLIFTSLITPTVEVKDSQMKTAAILDAAFQMPVCQCISTSSFFHQQQVYQLLIPKDGHRGYMCILCASEEEPCGEELGHK